MTATTISFRADEQTMSELREIAIPQTGEESWHVLADPEGNEFCLLMARLDPL